MTKPCSLVLTAALALAAARSASAQPGAQPAPTAPSAQPPSAASGDGRLSHIQGTPVPVGDHHQYYFPFRRTNLSTNPLGWILGIYGVSASYGLTQNLALRADVNYFNFVNTDDTGVEVGLGLPIYLRRTYSGAFLEPGFILRQFGSEDDRTAFGPQVLIGWHWMWDSGLNLAVAVGAGRSWSRSQSEDSFDDDEEVFANGYLRFGYAF